MLHSRGSTTASYHRVEEEQYEVLENEGFDSYYDAAVAALGRDSDHNPLSVSESSAAAPNPRRVSVPPDHGAALMRTVSGEGSVTLSHPAPDLQSIQGAYVGNVERLEHSAEQMSLNSDLEEEIRKLKSEQKRSESRRSSVHPASHQYSSASFSNSIRSINRVARSGGFSPEGYVASPVGSLVSPPWSSRSLHEQTAPAMDAQHRRFEPESEGLPLDSPMSVKPIPLTVRNSTSQEFKEQDDDQHADPIAGLADTLGVRERAPSAASGDTFQRAEKEFEAFDGVHVTAESRELEKNATETPRDSRMLPDVGETAEMRASMPTGPPREDMVFYPAPVPMMLNLPQRLSKAPLASKVAQRKSEVLQAAMANNRKSAPILGMEKVSEQASNHPSESSKRATELPPQLRATMFFDHNPVQHDVQVAQGSAVATLDSILDASAHAPVGAFTDHPIVGQLGSEVYGGSPEFSKTKVPKLKRHTRNPSSQMLGDRKSTSPLLHSPSHGITMVMEGDDGARDGEGNKVEGENGNTWNGTGLDREMEPLPSPKGNNADIDDAAEQEEYEEVDQEEDGKEDDEDAALSGRPTTLLAELQMRKAQQQQRNRTAATAFPNGMHSTLLEMDAVAQIQKQARRQKHVTLAWEDADASHPQDDAADEDVPLGILYPGKAAQKLNDPSAQWDEDRPLGLLAQRAMEDNEPLSRRRARLVGGTAGAKAFDEAKHANTLDLLASGRPASDNDDDEEGETLAQRKQRLKNQQRIAEPHAVSSDFASEVLSQLGGPKPEAPAADAPAAPDSKTPDPEETLGQRRKRLLAEKEARARQTSGEPASARATASAKRRSMADLLQAHPVGARHDPAAAHVPGIAPSGLVGGLDGWRPPIHAAAPPDPYRTHHGVAMAPPPGPPGPPASYINPMTYAPMMGMNSGTAAPSYAEAAPVAEHVILNPAQRAMIDRWRQSVA